MRRPKRARSSKISGRRGLINYRRKYIKAFSRVYTIDDIDEFGDALVDWMESDAKNFWFKDFCISRRIGPQRVTEFASKSKYFWDCLELAKDIQESRLVKIGILKKGAMPIFALKNVAGWRDIQEFDLGENTTEVAKEFAKMVSVAGTGFPTLGHQPIP